jgi:hypothetical protein
VREATSVLDPERVEALVARLSAEDRDAAVQGLALLARAAQQQMHEASHARRDRQPDDEVRAEPGKRKGGLT